MKALSGDTVHIILPSKEEVAIRIPFAGEPGLTEIDEERLRWANVEWSITDKTLFVMFPFL